MNWIDGLILALILAGCLLVVARALHGAKRQLLDQRRMVSSQDAAFWGDLRRMVSDGLPIPLGEGMTLEQLNAQWEQRPCPEWCNGQNILCVACILKGKARDAENRTPTVTDAILHAPGGHACGNFQVGPPREGADCWGDGDERCPTCVWWEFRRSPHLATDPEYVAWYHGDWEAVQAIRAQKAEDRATEGRAPQ